MNNIIPSILLFVVSLALLDSTYTFKKVKEGCKTKQEITINNVKYKCERVSNEVK